MLKLDFYLDWRGGRRGVVTVRKLLSFVVACSMVFGSVPAPALAEAVEEALYEARMAEALRASRADYEAGRYYTSREDLKAAVESKRAADA